MEWWQEFFGEDYLKCYKDITEHEGTKKEVDFIIDIIKPKKKDKILDLCCGYGRHSIEIAKRGYKIAGFDYSEYLLNIAKYNAEKENLKIGFIQGDTRKLNFKNEFNLIINIFTSFGYFKDDKDNEKVIKNISLALKPGGKFLIDTINRDYIIKNFRPQSSSKIGNIIVMEETKFDILKSRTITKKVIIEDKERKEYNYGLRIYTYKEFENILNNAGLSIVESYGNFDKQKFDVDAPRMIIVAKKEK